MASLTQWMWVWANSWRQWRTGKPGMLQSRGSQSQTWLSHWTTTRLWKNNSFHMLNLLSFSLKNSPSWEWPTILRLQRRLVLVWKGKSKISTSSSIVHWVISSWYIILCKVLLLRTKWNEIFFWKRVNYLFQYVILHSLKEMKYK